MSVTRIEGTRPLEAAQAHTTLQSRVPGEAKKAEHAEHKPPAQEPVPQPPSESKPYAVSFRFEKELNRVVVKVIDAVTGEAILQIPAESVIEALKQQRHAPGGLVDEEA
jgi:uncharacterized FlaG/YvyC family protein